MIRLEGGNNIAVVFALLKSIDEHTYMICLSTFCKYCLY